jgi:hypothetical protein
VVRPPSYMTENRLETIRVEEVRKKGRPQGILLRAANA